MARILLIGRGPMPTADTPQLGFSQLRTQAFYNALVQAGHDVRLIALVPEAATSRLETWAQDIRARIDSGASDSA